MVEVKSYTELLMFTEESPLRVPEGNVIFAEGEQASEMFVVREGTVELRKGDVVVQTLAKGTIFGEMALLDPAPRSATAVAGPNCELVMIDEKLFLQLVQRVPGFALEILRLVVRRLRTEMSKSQS